MSKDYSEIGPHWSKDHFVREVANQGRVDWFASERITHKRRIERQIHFPPPTGRRAGICHKDYLLSVPVYRYIRPCQHLIFYREPVPWGEWAWCATCKTPFQHDENTREIAPRSKAKMLWGERLPKLIDEAIVRNRVADLLWETGTQELSRELKDDIAKTIGCGTTTVYEVAADLGIEISLE